MAQEGMLDLLLKTLEDIEKRRTEAKERNRADLNEFMAAVEARLPQVEKRVGDLHSSLGDLSAKVEQLESAMLRQAKAEKAVGDIKEEPTAASPSPTPSISRSTRRG
uniref:Uncharacterized protein n=1 Tax=Oryza glumipatula TaxID=40148 RepID=A0A0E0BDI4_9ORYZ